MRVLRRIDMNRAIGIGKRPVPMFTNGRGIGIAQRLRRADAIKRIECLDTDVREIRIGNHERSRRIADGVPRVKRSHLSLGTGVDVDAPHPAGPIDKGKFPRPWNPRFVRNPLIFLHVTRVKATVTATVAVNHPNPVGERACVVEQIRVVWAKLQMPNAIPAQNDFMFPGIGIHNGERGFFTDVKSHRPPIVIVAERGCSHRRGHHAFLLHRGCGEVHQLALLKRLQR